MKGKNPNPIIWPKSLPMTCQYPGGFRWLTTHPKPEWDIQLVKPWVKPHMTRNILKRSSEEANR